MKHTIIREHQIGLGKKTLKNGFTVLNADGPKVYKMQWCATLDQALGFAGRESDITFDSAWELGCPCCAENFAVK